MKRKRKRKETIEFVRDTPVMIQHPFQEDYWPWDYFGEGEQKVIHNRKVFNPPNADPSFGCHSRYEFELWDDYGFISVCRIRIKVWNDNVKMLLNEEAAR